MTATAIGFRVKSGWAMTVVVSGPVAAPTVLDVRRVDLSDPRVPESIQPFHQALERPGAGGSKAVTRLVTVVRDYSRSAVGAMLKEIGARTPLIGAGVVVGSQVDPASIGNDHIRAHAEEGRLFREAVVEAATDAGLTSIVISEKQLFAKAVATLERSEAELKQDLIALGRNISGGWRSEQKGAALAAWIVLASTPV